MGLLTAFRKWEFDAQSDGQSSHRQEWLCNLRGPIQNENMRPYFFFFFNEALFKKDEEFSDDSCRVLYQMGVHLSEPGARSDCTGHTPGKLASHAHRWLVVGLELDVGFVQCCAWGDRHNLYLVTWEVVKPVATVRRFAQSEAKKKNSIFLSTSVLWNYKLVSTAW